MTKETNNMALREQKGNMYSFVSHTWNPIVGKCPHDCSYCYMKGFKLPDLHLKEGELKVDLSKADFIFIGSGTDMFSRDVPKEWIQRVLEHCNKYPDVKYLFQSKNPIRFHEHGLNFPPKSVFGTTIETDDESILSKISITPAPIFRAIEMQNLGEVEKMVTIEPIMKFNLDSLATLIEMIKPSWVNIGADSKGNNLQEPTWDEILKLVERIEEFTVIKKKSNLKRLQT